MKVVSEYGVYSQEVPKTMISFILIRTNNNYCFLIIIHVDIDSGDVKKKNKFISQGSINDWLTENILV